jgi:hypothetical protein
MNWIEANLAQPSGQIGAIFFGLKDSMKSFAQVSIYSLQKSVALGSAPNVEEITGNSLALFWMTLS